MSEKSNTFAGFDSNDKNYKYLLRVFNLMNSITKQGISQGCSET